MLPLLDDAARPDLRSLGFSELSALVSRLGEQPYRARQLYSWLHRKGAASLDAMTDLPRAFRERLAAETRLTTLAVDAVQQSSDGTRKYRMRTWDGKFIESVYMPDESGPQSFDPEADEQEPDIRVRRTLCVSTQVGCAMGCGFCMTATMGLVRNLTAGEICDQVYRVNDDLRRLGVPGERPLKVNLIAYNGSPGLGFGGPGAERVVAFRKALDARGVTAMVRKNRGRDIAAACGQLAVQGQREARGGLA